MEGARRNAAIDARSREIDDPNNSEHYNDRGNAEAEHEPDIMPGHALSSLTRRYYRASLRAFGRTHGVLLIWVLLICVLISEFPVLIALPATG
jgi:hypothetical protein